MLVPQTLFRVLTFALCCLFAFAWPRVGTAQTAADIRVLIEENLAAPVNMLMLGPVRYEAVIVEGEEPNYGVEITGLTRPNGEVIGSARFRLERNLGFAYTLTAGRYDFSDRSVDVPDTTDTPNAPDTAENETPAALQAPLDGQLVPQNQSWSGVWSFQFPQRYEVLNWQLGPVTSPEFSATNLALRLVDRPTTDGKTLAVQLQGLVSGPVDARTKIAALDLKWDLTSQSTRLFSLASDIAALWMNPVYEDEIERDTFLLSFFDSAKGPLPHSAFALTLSGLELPTASGSVALDQLELRLDQQEQSDNRGVLGLDAMGKDLALRWEESKAELAIGQFSAAISLNKLSPHNLLPHLGELILRFNQAQAELSEGDPAAVGELIAVLAELDFSDAAVKIKANKLRYLDSLNTTNILHVDQLGMTSQHLAVDTNQGSQDLLYYADGINHQRETAMQSITTSLNRAEWKQQVAGLNLSSSLDALMRLVFLPSFTPTNDPAPARLSDLFDYALNFDSSKVDWRFEGFRSQSSASDRVLAFDSLGAGLSFEGMRAQDATIAARLDYQGLDIDLNLDAFGKAAFPTDLTFEQSLELSDFQQLFAALSEKQRLFPLSSDSFYEQELRPLLSILTGQLPGLLSAIKLDRLRFNAPMISGLVTADLARADEEAKLITANLDLRVEGMNALRDAARESAKGRPGAPGAVFLASIIPFMGYVKDPAGDGTWVIEMRMPNWGELKINDLPLPKQIERRIFSAKLKDLLATRLFPDPVTTPAPEELTPDEDLPPEDLAQPASTNITGEATGNVIGDTSTDQGE